MLVYLAVNGSKKKVMYRSIYGALKVAKRYDKKGWLMEPVNKFPVKA